MFKLIQQLLLVLLMSSILVGAIGCRSNSGAAATGGTYAPYGSPTYTPSERATYSPGQTTPAALPASSGGGSCPHCK